MTFLPIVERELRVRARQKFTHRFRVGSALVAMLLVMYLLVTGSLSSPRSIGKMIFQTLAWLSFAYCLLEGVRTTADCLSEEKRAGTLGLLFLTDLKGYDVVLGKLIASSLNSFYALLAIFPPLAIPILIGGVTGAEFWRLVLMLVNTLFFSLCSGMFVSAVSRDERNSLANTLALILCLTFVPVVFQRVPSPAISWLASLSPGVGFVSLFDAAYSANPDRFDNSVWMIPLLSWSFLIGASALLPRTWQGEAVRAKPGAVELLVQRLAPLKAQAKKTVARRRMLLHTNPILWLAWSQQRSPVFLWILIAFAGGAGVGSWFVVAFSAQPGVVRSIAGPIYAIGAVALVVHLATALSVAAQASSFFPDARSSGALELLLCTPLTVGEIVEGHREALKRMFGPPVITFGVVTVIIVIGHLLLSTDLSAPTLLVPPVVILCLVVLMTELYATGEYGMWQGLVARKPTQALTKTVLYVLAFPLVAAVCLCALWPVLAVVKNVIFINYARDQLRRRFRLVATERFVMAGQSEAAPPPLLRGPHDLPSVLSRKESEA